jgi:hypothetical protein
MTTISTSTPLTITLGSHRVLAFVGSVLHPGELLPHSFADDPVSRGVRPAFADEVEKKYGIRVKTVTHPNDPYKVVIAIDESPDSDFESRVGLTDEQIVSRDWHAIAGQYGRYAISVQGNRAWVWQFHAPITHPVIAFDWGNTKVDPLDVDLIVGRTRRHPDSVKSAIIEFCKSLTCRFPEIYISDTSAHLIV